jgi:predicted transcriptional regulator
MIQGNEIEISEVDTRFEGLKTRDKDREKKLVGDLSKGDLLTPLLATEINGVLVLLDGFKRLRAAITLKWSTIRCLTVAENEVTGILELLHRSRGHKMDLYSEASFVSRLHKEHRFSLAKLANELGRSKSWVSMRTLFTDGMTARTEDQLRSGTFPLHAWIYSIRPFMRMNDKNKSLAEEFVDLCVKQHYTLREIDILARIWFEQGEGKRNELRKGHGEWILKQLQAKVKDGHCLSSKEQADLKVLAHLEGAIRQFNTHPFVAPEQSSSEYRAQAHISCLTIVSNMNPIKTKLEAMYDQCGRS